MGIKLVLIVSVLAQFVSAFFALRLIKITGVRRAWLLMAASIFLMGVRRSLMLIGLQTHTIVDSGHIYNEEFIAMVISIMMLLGTALIAPLFYTIKRSEEAAKESEAKMHQAYRQLRNMVDFMPDAILVINTDKKVIAWNRAMEEMSGVSREAMLGQGEYAYSVPFYGERRQVLIDFVGSEECEKPEEYDYIKVNGNTMFATFVSPALNNGQGAYLWAKAAPLFDEEGKQIGAIESLRDISDHKRDQKRLEEYRTYLEQQVQERTSEIVKANEELKREILVREQAEEKLQMQEAFLRLMASSSPLGFLVVDQRFEEIVYVNHSFCEIWKLEALEEQLAQGDIKKKSQLLPHLLELVKDQADFLEGCVGMNQVEQRVLVDDQLALTDGRIIRRYSRQIRDGNDKYHGDFYIFEDITERTRLTQELQRLERLNVIGEMAAGIAHEVRNPLTTVRGYLQLLEQQDQLSGYEKQFNLMIEELDRANNILSDFLSIGRNKELDLTSANLNKIIRALIDLMRADAAFDDKFIKLNLRAVPLIMLDEKEIRQLILNLVRNGLEAMDAGGTLTIKTYLEHNQVVMAICDQGKGIAQSIMGNLGKPFFTTKERGTGLGLAICYTIANRHNAVINVDTGEKGTNFFVRFPQNNNE